MDGYHFFLWGSLIVGFYMAWNIGANDVANAMGTSVGSKALTLKKAIIIAAILEFSGAYFVGSNVSETIMKGIISPEDFAKEPIVFVMGMMSALLATGLWLQIASFFGLPVSTTHAIVGAVLGFGVLVAGFFAVDWSVVAQIVLSWVISPLLSGFFSYLLFSLVQKKIFYSADPTKAARKITPYLAASCFFVLTLSVVYNGLSNLAMHFSFLDACLAAVLLGFVGFLLFGWKMRFLQTSPEKPKAFRNPQHLLSLEKAIKHLERVHSTSSEEEKAQVLAALEQTRKLREKVQENTLTKERYYSLLPVEKSFALLQILSACLVAFAHGANDVANAIGPVAAIFEVINTTTISIQAKVPSWLLVFGGIGIVTGLATWGWRVIETIGKKITELTPTRGFCAEFGAASTILLASKLGLPISTTHSLVGAVLGVGMARGLRAINLHTIRDIVLSWIVTIPLCAFICLALFYMMQTLLRFSFLWG